MAYKDKDRQRAANTERQRRYKAKQKALLSEGVTNKALPREIHNFPNCNETLTGTMTLPKRGKDIKCFADLPPDVQDNINWRSESNEEKQKRTVAAIEYQHLFPNRYEPQDAVCTGVVTGKPGDEDYNGICTPKWRTKYDSGLCPASPQIEPGGHNKSMLISEAGARGRGGVG